LSVDGLGNYAVGWVTTDSDSNSYYQAMQYDSEGAISDSPLTVATWSSTTTTDAPSLTEDGIGGFVAAWTQTPDEFTDPSALMAEHFNAAGSTAGAFVVDPNANADYLGWGSRYPQQSIAASNGTWTVMYGSGSTDNLVARMYNTDDNPLGNSFTIGETSQDDVDGATGLAANAEGEYFGVWSDSVFDEETYNRNYTISGQQFQLSGVSPLVDSQTAVGTNTTSYDAPPTLMTAVDGAGTKAVAWIDGGHNLIVQFYNSSGEAIGSPVQVNPDGDTVGPNASGAAAVSISANNNGTFAFAWMGTTGLEVIRYSDSGGTISAIDADPITVAADADGVFTSVGVTDDGGFIAGWSQPSGSDEVIETQKFNSGGTAVGSPTTVATITASYTFTNAQLSVAGDGSYVVGWQTADESGNQYFQALQYASDGTAVEDSPLSVATWSSSITVGEPTITVDGVGGFIATWVQTPDLFSTYSSLMARHFDATGNASGAFVVDNMAGGNYLGWTSRFPSQTVVTGGGNWCVVWFDGTTYNIMGRFYTNSDQAIGSAFVVANTGGDYVDGSIQLSSNDDGDFHVAWSTSTINEDYNRVHVMSAQRLQASWLY